jgi:hypothetical protein
MVIDMRKNMVKRCGAGALAGVVALCGILGGIVTEKKVLAEDTTVVTVDASQKFASNNGVFEGWGTSLCWFGNRIGGSESTSEEAAKLLCSQEDGLGLNIIRFNIGGGDDPTHDHITRTDSKMPGYWGEYDESTGEFDYDFTKDSNQRNVLLKMLSENPDLTLEAFSNSAPYFMTNSGCTSGSEDGGDNLKDDQYENFADYLVTVVENYRDLYGVNFTSIEAMNENGWSISRNGAKQEGCSFAWGTSQSKMITALNDALTNHNLQNLILAGCDESSPAEMLKSLNYMSSEALNVLERVDTHTYSTSSEAKLRDKVVELGKSLWMSEVDGSDTAGSNAGEMGAALGFAKRIGLDMANLQPSAWIMWQAIGSYCGKESFAGNNDPETLDQHSMDTNGFWGVTYADMDQEKVVLTKKYYGFAQYTKYIHAGDSMIQSDKENTISYDEKNQELKIVTYNTKNQDVTKQYDFQNLQVSDGTVEVIRTSGDLETGENLAQLDDLKADSNGFAVTLAPNSITTFVVKGVTDVSPKKVSTTQEPSPEPTATVQPDMTTETPAAVQPDVTPEPITTVQPVATTEEPAAQTKVTGVKVSGVQKKKAKITWDKASEADSYLVAYSTSKAKLAKQKKASTQAASGVRIKKVSKNAITLTGLKKKTKYFVKVSAGGDYSAVKSFTTKK